jgi:hypothetical protein
MEKPTYPRPEPTSLTIMSEPTRADKIFDCVAIGIGSLTIVGLMAVLIWMIVDYEVVQSFFKCWASTVAR